MGTKKTQRFGRLSRHKLLVMVLAVCVLAGLSYLVWDRALRRYHESARAAELVSVRELLLLAADSTVTDAPVEPRTGDVYFPEARLYLPRVPTLAPLAYTFFDDGQLNVSSRSVSNQSKVRLLAARNMNELFAAVPELQACQRGVRLMYQKSEDSSVALKHTVKLNNGKDLYLYTEEACPELVDTLD